MNYVFLSFSIIAFLVSIVQIYFINKYGIDEDVPYSPFSTPLGTTRVAQIANKVGFPLVGAIIAFILFLFA